MADFITKEQFNKYKTLVDAKDNLKIGARQFYSDLLIGGTLTFSLGRANEIGYLLGGVPTLYLLYKDFERYKQYKNIESQLNDLEKRLSQ